MEIGPIDAIRPVPMKPSPAAPDLSRVFEIDYLGQSRDDDYTPANRKAPRGLEDQEDDFADDSSEPVEQPDSENRPSNLNFFA